MTEMITSTPIPDDEAKAIMTDDLEALRRNKINGPLIKALDEAIEGLSLAIATLSRDTNIEDKQPKRKWTKLWRR